MAVILVAYRAIDIAVDVLARGASEDRDDARRQPGSLVAHVDAAVRDSRRILFVLQNLDVNVSSLVAGLGLGGLAIALAAQDTVRNVLGGVTIFADKPFEVGDWVVVDGVEGTVETVGFRSTRVRTFYNSLVSVPNGNLMNAGIDNMGQRRWRRYKTTLGVGYHTKPDQMQAFVEGIRAIIQASPGMRQDYYIVEFHGFGATSLDVLVYCFMDAARLERGTTYPARPQSRHHEARRIAAGRLRLPDTDCAHRRDAGSAPTATAASANGLPPPRGRELVRRRVARAASASTSQ